MSQSLTLNDLRAAVAGGGAALRLRHALQPGGGDGGKVYPPTYEGGVYAEEKRRVPGRDEPVPCVLLDSVQSQANRIEEALQDAIDEGRVSLPVIEVRFDHLPTVEPGSDEPGLYEPIGRVTSLEAPHRVADAILRDSETEDGTAFRRSEAGRKLDFANVRDATPLYELCPTALLLGLWDSTGPKGGLGAKFQRALVSEIVGIGAQKGTGTGSRIDPLGIQSVSVYEAADGSGYTVDEAKARKDRGKAVPYKKKGKPSEANHGNVTPSLHDPSGTPLPGGVTIASAELTTVISLPALRRLRFPVDGEQSRERNVAGRTVLAAIGLAGTALMLERGLDLRSRCLLVPEAEEAWELVDAVGGGTRPFSLDADAALALLAEAVEAAASNGLRWMEAPLVLRPSEKLAELLQKSQKAAATKGADEGGEE